jgi:hypothetical protein
LEFGCEYYIGYMAKITWKGVGRGREGEGREREGGKVNNI